MSRIKISLMVWWFSTKFVLRCGKGKKFGQSFCCVPPKMIQYINNHNYPTRETIKIILIIIWWIPKRPHCTFQQWLNCRCKVFALKVSRQIVYSQMTLSKYWRQVWRPDVLKQQLKFNLDHQENQKFSLMKAAQL